MSDDLVARVYPKLRRYLRPCNREKLYGKYLHVIYAGSGSARCELIGYYAPFNNNKLIYRSITRCNANNKTHLVQCDGQ